MNNKHCGHYTTQTGLMGIISTESIYATNIMFLNDEQEFQHALILIKDILTKSDKIKPDSHLHSVYQQFIDDLKRKLDTLDGYESTPIFTVSFSEETDLLSQWRGYCPDNNGYCVIFDLDNVFYQVKQKYEDAHLISCVYADEDKNIQLRNLLNKYWELYIANKQNNEKKEILDRLAKDIILLASYFKHSSFSEEKERRIIIILEHDPINNIQFREGRFSVVPYIELPLSKRFIKKIIIGPSQHKELSKRALDMFLENSYEIPRLFSKVDLEISKTPYRQW